MSELPRRAWVQQLMGLPVSVHVRGAALEDDDGARSDVEAAVAELFAELRRLDARFSTYRPDSEVSLLRARASAPGGDGAPGEPSPLLAEVQHLCAVARGATGGAFDADLPGGWDPSGLVKGWAVERAVRPLRAVCSELGLDWLVDAGGDVLLRAVDGRTWSVGVEDPADPSRLLGALRLRDGAVATSGSVHRGAHVVDPETGRPASTSVQATVLGPSLLWADVFATAAVVKASGGAEVARAWLDTLSGYRGSLASSP
ncbi:MAG: FAD:protein FMN transferase [Quadrisphaera sp.]